MNKDALREYYQRRYEHHHKCWEETGSDQDMQEALNYLNALERLKAS